MSDVQKYGRHLRAVVNEVRAMPASEQRAQAGSSEQRKNASTKVASGVKGSKAR